METSAFISSFEPTELLRRRFSPLVICVIDKEVDKIASLCGFPFFDILAAISNKQNFLVRFVDHNSVIQHPFESFLTRVQDDITSFSTSFTSEEYEKNGSIDASKASIPNLMPKTMKNIFNYSSIPPWYLVMINRIISHMRFADFFYPDLPICILYATAPGSKLMNPDQIRQYLELPLWMRDYIPFFPIAHVFIYDGLVSSSIPGDYKTIKTNFEFSYPLSLRSRKIESKRESDLDILKDLFRYDQSLLTNPNLGSFFGQTDYNTITDFLMVFCSQFVVNSINATFQNVSIQIEQSKKLSSVVKGFFKKAPNPSSTHMSIPFSKLNIGYIASLLLFKGELVDSLKFFKQFSELMEESNLPFVSFQTNFIEYLITCTFPNMLSQSENYNELLFKKTFSLGSVPYCLYFCLVNAEFDIKQKQLSKAILTLKNTLKFMHRFWSIKSIVGNLLITSLIRERISSIEESMPHKIFWLSLAKQTYLQSNQYSHSIRCCIWALKHLPESQWPILKQTNMLDMAMSLAHTYQSMRALSVCKALFALPNLEKSLHQDVLSQFLAPINEIDLESRQNGVSIDSLLDVMGISVISINNPEYWGYSSAGFKTLIKEFSPWVHQFLDRRTNRSFDCWILENQSVQNNVIAIPIDTPIKLLLSLRNKYNFIINLDRAQLKAQHNSDDEHCYRMDPVADKNIPVSTHPIIIEFIFEAKKEGRYTINTFEKNYWGYIVNRVVCGPVLFEAKKDFPRVQFFIEHIPKESYLYQCDKFIVRISNICPCEVSDLFLTFDHPKTIAYDGEVSYCESIGIIRIHDSIMPGETKSLQLIYRAAKLGINRVHFVISSGSQLIAYQYSEFNVVKSIDVNASIVPNRTDTNNWIIKTKITPYISGIKIFGIIDKDCRLLKSLPTSTNQDLISDNSTTHMSFSDDTESITDESWRVYMMGNSSYSLLLHFPGKELYAQHNLRVFKEEVPRLKLFMESESSEPLGSRNKCKISIVSGLIPQYIQPLPFVYGNVSNESSKRFHGCKWVGSTRKSFLQDDNVFSTTFEFVAFKYGIYRTSGFLLFFQSNPEAPTYVELSQLIHINHK